MIPRAFWLNRVEDESGVSGTGRIAEGVLFSDGTCALRWRTKTRSSAFYANMADLIAIHGHGGKTRVVYLDKPGTCSHCGHPEDAHWMDNCGGCDVAGCQCTTMNCDCTFV